MRVHDVHAHIVPRPMVEPLRQRGRIYGVEVERGTDGLDRFVVEGVATATPLLASLVDVEERLGAMDRTGVEVQLLSPFVETTAYELDVDDAVAYSRWFNESLAAVVAEHPDRFVGVANVPLRHPARAATVLRHAVTELGMVGCEIATTVAGQDLDAVDLEEFWAAAEELGCTVLLHPMRALSGRSVTRYFLGNLVGNPAESTVAVAHLILSGVLERHPGLRLCVVHGGGFLPYQLGRLDRGYRARPDLVGLNLSRSPSEWARSLYYDTVTHSAAALRFLIDLVGSAQVVLGSDHPFPMGDPDPVATVRGVAHLAPDDERRLLGANVEQLLAGIRR